LPEEASHADEHDLDAVLRGKEQQIPWLNI